MSDTHIVEGVDLVAAAKSAVLTNSQPKIDELRELLNNIISNTNQDALDSLTELASFVTDNGDLLSAINSLSDANLNKITALSDDLQAEIIRATGKESTINSNVTNKMQAILNMVNTESANRANQDSSLSSNILTKHNQAITAIEAKESELQAVDALIHVGVSNLAAADVTANNEIAALKTHETGQNETLYHMLHSIDSTLFDPDGNSPSNSDADASSDSSSGESQNDASEVAPTYDWVNGINGLYYAEDAPTITPDGYARFQDPDNTYVAFISIADRTGAWSTTQIMDKLSNQGVDSNIHQAPSADLIAFINSYNMVTSSTFSGSGTYTKEAIEAGDVSYDNIVKISSDNSSRLVLQEHERVDITYHYNLGLRTVYAEIPQSSADRSDAEMLPVFHKGIRGLYLAENVPHNIGFVGYSKFTDLNNQYVVFMQTTASANAYTAEGVTDAVKSSLGFDENKIIPDFDLIKFMDENNMVTSGSLDSTLIGYDRARDWTNQSLETGQVNRNNAGMTDPQDTSRIVISAGNYGYSQAKLRGVYAKADLTAPVAPDYDPSQHGRQPGPEIPEQPTPEAVLMPQFANDIEGLYTAGNKPANVDMAKYAEFSSADGQYFAYLAVTPSSSGYQASQVNDALKSSLGWTSDDTIPTLALIQFIISNNMVADKNLSDSGNWKDWTIEALADNGITATNAASVVSMSSNMLEFNSHTHHSGKLRSAYVGS